MKRPWAVPDSLTLYSQTIKTVFTPEEIIIEGDRVDGLSHYNQNLILLYTPPNYPSSTVKMIFCHELMHFFLYYAGDEQLSYNENFAQGCAILFHQFLNTAEYSNKTTIIPNRFQLGGLGEIVVKRKKEIIIDGDECFAHTDFYSNSILVCKESSEHSTERLEVAFIMQLLVFFSFIRADSIFARKSRVYKPWAHLIHQFLKGLYNV